jgi:hypothetical protein
MVTTKRSASSHAVIVCRRTIKPPGNRINPSKDTKRSARRNSSSIVIFFQGDVLVILKPSNARHVNNLHVHFEAITLLFLPECDDFFFVRPCQYHFIDASSTMQFKSF